MMSSFGIFFCINICAKASKSSKLETYCIGRFKSSSQSITNECVGYPYTNLCIISSACDGCCFHHVVNIFTQYWNQISNALEYSQSFLGSISV